MNILNVGMGEIKISKTPGDVIVAPGLGSCIGLIVFDPTTKVAAMAHVVSPDSSISRTPEIIPGKFGDTALTELIRLMTEYKCNKANLKVVIAGGSQMFNLEKGTNVLNIGMRNTISVKATINSNGLPLIASDTGGNRGRTLKIDVATCSITVRHVGEDERILGGNICQKF